MPARPIPRPALVRRIGPGRRRPPRRDCREPLEPPKYRDACHLPLRAARPDADEPAYARIAPRARQDSRKTIRQSRTGAAAASRSRLWMAAAAAAAWAMATLIW